MALDFQLELDDALPTPAQTKTLLFHPQWQAQAPRAATPQATSFAERWAVLCEVGEHNDLPGQVLRLRTSETELAERYSAYAEQLRQWLQGMLHAKPTGAVLLQLVVPNEGQGALLQGLGGLLRSAEQENPKLKSQVLAVEAGVGTQELHDRLQHQSRGLAPAVRYEQGIAHVIALEEVSAAPAQAPWRDDGVYLITGGAGGLGLIFAQAIATRAKRVTLILTGRPAPSE